MAKKKKKKFSGKVLINGIFWAIAILYIIFRLLVTPFSVFWFDIVIIVFVTMLTLTLYVMGDS